MQEYAGVCRNMQEYTIVHNDVLYHVYSIRALIWNISEKAVACRHKSTTHQCTFSWDPKFLGHMYALYMYVSKYFKQ